MILVADSGSTKTDWKELNSGTEFETAGFNPHVIGQDFITNQLSETDFFKQHSSVIQSIHFYGAGCSSDFLCNVVKSGIQKVTSNADISIYHDLLGAARATWNGSTAVTSILGTGSNSCWYDGNEIVQSKPSLGFILGDEGSGRDLGGRLVRGYLYDEMPSDLKSLFESAFPNESQELITKLYAQERPNRFLASFVPFILANRNNQYIEQMVKATFQSFVSTHLLPYMEKGDFPYHFIGSIAHYFKNELELVLDKNNLKLGRVIQKPIDGLTNYHRF